MAVSTLPAAGGLDVDELSNKLSTIPTLYEEGAEPKEQEGAELQAKEAESSDETSSTAAVFGSEGGEGGTLHFKCLCTFLFVHLHVLVERTCVYVYLYGSW